MLITNLLSNSLRRSPHGERGLKLHIVKHGRLHVGRSPHGERGLKSALRYAQDTDTRSLSSRRAWIEIVRRGPSHLYCNRSLSSRRAWIEIVNVCYLFAGDGSLSSRRAWIEIRTNRRLRCRDQSLSSRRAWIEIRQGSRLQEGRHVALLTESVD